MNIAIKVALMEAGIMSQDMTEPNIKNLKEFLTNREKLQDRTVKGGRIISSSTSLPFGKGGNYLVETIYHTSLTEQQKESIYVSEYEIGNPNPIKSLNIDDLYIYLEDAYGGSAEDLVKSIKKEISNLTNIPFKEFLEKDRSLAYKVITLFYRIRRQFKSQLFNFIDIDTKEKLQFEFRASFPYRGSKKGQGYQNTAVLAEILAHLTFSMPQEYLKQAKFIEDDLTYIADQISKHVRDYIKLTNRFVVTSSDDEQITSITGMVDRNIEDALQTIFKNRETKRVHRLDFLLYVLLTLKEYKARKLSNDILVKLVPSIPLNLQPFSDKACKTWKDEDVIPYLLGKGIKASKSIEKQTDFLEKYIAEHNFLEKLSLGEDIDNITLLPRQNRQVLKALIIHDSAIDNIKVDSFLFSDKELPSSITSVLKKGAKALDEYKTKGAPFSYENYPEAILLYWMMRYQLALKIVLSKDKQDTINQFQRVADWDIRIDDMLVDYVTPPDLDTYSRLVVLPEKLRTSLTKPIIPL